MYGSLRSSYLISWYCIIVWGSGAAQNMAAASAVPGVLRGFVGTLYWDIIQDIGRKDN